MEDLRIGQLLRAARRRLGWRQADVAKRAGVSQQLVARVEAGRLAGMTLGTVRSVAAALEVRVQLSVLWRGGAGDRLLDARHAALVNAVVGVLRLAGWTCVVEYTFSHYGERGSVDVLAWHSAFRALLIIEVKSRVFDVQALFSGIDRKARVVPALVARDRGWQPVTVGCVVALEESHANRSMVHRHAEAFAAAVPSSSRDVRRWLRNPVDPLAGLWFLSFTTDMSGKRNGVGPERVRAPRPRSERVQNRRSSRGTAPGEAATRA